jgi:fatty acid desaturase
MFACKFGRTNRHHRTMIDPGRTISSQGLPRAEEELSALPIWAFTLGIFALLTFGLTAVPSIVCGHLALAQTRTDGRGSLAKSVTLVALVIGYGGVAVLGAWIAVLARHLLH